MSQKTALKTVGILVLISVLALGINAILIKAFPEKFGREEQLQEVDIQEEKAEADELPLNEMNISDTTKNNRDVWSWPYDSAVPVYHHANLDIYQGRIKEDTTLEGITIYLSMDSIADQTSLNETQSETEEETAPDQDIDQDLEDTTIFETLPNIFVDDEDMQTILENITQYTKESFEALGAEVVVIDSRYSSDLSKAAFVGLDILEDFSDELAEQNFKSERLDKLRDPLQEIQNSDQPQSGNSFFSEIGVSKDQRLLLDVERQYTDRIFINLQFGKAESEEISGSRVKFLGNETSAIGAQIDEINDESPEKPAYVGYATEDRNRYAKLTEKNISQLLPGLTYSGDEAIVEQILPSLRLINLTSVDIEIGQKNRSFDLQILKSVEQQKIIAEAISNACYEFYCTDF